MVIGNLTTIIQGIYEKGGRKFAFMNLPRLWCLPGMRILTTPGNGECLEEASSLSSLHNQALGRALRKLEKKLKGFKYSLFDTNYIFGHMTENPSIYGLSEVKVACCGAGVFRGVFSCGGKRTVKEFELCGDPSQHLFWDSYHATEAAYDVISNRMWSGDDAGPRFVGPYTVEQLFTEP
ncbi:hypothetical protein MLD38_007141 [Melastoma candidum]|uniref:Uncharacterized protein n=1 Tax=Melastoma candidum TaxID=119954 RepID=A0ACB9RRI1_9MYRT|nr:hypothetical protein MLD38_007141 [Melastoma candidum]